jgi:hypothetical protein
LNRCINGEDFVKFLKAQKVRWLGHVKRMDVRAMPRKKKKRKTPPEMDERCCSRLDSNEDKAVDREDKR